MSFEIHAVYALPFCPEASGKQTDISKKLRLSTAAMGIILTIIGGMGILSAHGLVQNFFQTSPPLVWSLASIGTLLLLVAFSVKCVR